MRDAVLQRRRSQLGEQPTPSVGSAKQGRASGRCRLDRRWRPASFEFCLSERDRFGLRAGVDPAIGLASSSRLRTGLLARASVRPACSTTANSRALRKPPLPSTTLVRTRPSSNSKSRALGAQPRSRRARSSSKRASSSRRSSAAKLGSTDCPNAMRSSVECLGRRSSISQASSAIASPLLLRRTRPGDANSSMATILAR